ncbi:hypothetical protein F4553_005595 [Allocatelliglobosispora scoriae]|uniref:Sensor domain-containing protein n=1 Tax=Allocatelliglobosispora scoriae TaxID=643052 RepID=A0A841BZS4_9ACTN|nr:hypothetical protein [Allocatelliglobosispora scoriae]MBB5872161.1 hypothetical protein [Allocatelliglobosispora scoriae]
MRLDRARRRAIVTGAALGCVTVGVLTLLGVLGLRPHPRSDPHPGPREAIQADLQTAQVAGPDLPLVLSPSATLPSSPAPRTEASNSRCRALVADPAELISLASASGRNADGDASTRHIAPDKSVLDQALRVLSSGDAAKTFDSLLATTKACRDFTTVVDGARVRVRLDAGKPGLPLLGRSYTVRLTVSSATSTKTGYLAVGRVGSAISVLRRLGPTSAEQQLDQQVAELLDQTLSKILPLQPEAKTSPGGA